jgi:hypothetical protein
MNEVFHLIRTLIDENEFLKKGKLKLSKELLLGRSKKYLESQYENHIRNIVDQNISQTNLSEKKLIQLYLEIRFKKPNWPKQFTVISCFYLSFRLFKIFQFGQ